jgi:hypothetical protein
LSRLGKFLAHIHPKVIASTLASALVTAFAPMVPQLIQHGTVKVSGGQLGLAALVGLLTFLSGYMKNGHFGPVAQEIVKAALDAVEAMRSTPDAPTWTVPVSGAASTAVFHVMAGGGPPPPPAAPLAAGTDPLLDSPPGTGTASVLASEPETKP